MGSRQSIMQLFYREGCGLLKRFGTAEGLGIISCARSFKMEVNKDMG